MTCDMIINQSQLHFVVSSSCAYWARLAVVQWLCHCWHTPLGCALNDLVVLLSQCVLNLGCESRSSHPSLCQHPLQSWKLRFPVSSSFWVLLSWRHTKKWGKKEREQGHPSRTHECRRWWRKVTCTLLSTTNLEDSVNSLNMMQLASVKNSSWDLILPNGTSLRIGGASPFWAI